MSRAALVVLVGYFFTNCETNDQQTNRQLDTSVAKFVNAIRESHLNEKQKQDEDNIIAKLNANYESSSDKVSQIVSSIKAAGPPERVISDIGASVAKELGAYFEISNWGCSEIACFFQIVGPVIADMKSHRGPDESSLLIRRIQSKVASNYLFAVTSDAPPNRLIVVLTQ